jgi:hypothetical protein
VAVDALMTIPAELRDRPQWIPWRSEPRRDRPDHPAKVPWRVDGSRRVSTTNPNGWGTLKQAVAARFEDERFDGVGFVFTAEDPYTGIDLDGCIDANGELHPAAAKIIEKLDGYAERSPSGTGIHIIVAAELRSVRRQTTKTPWGGKFEVYDHARFFTVTGKGAGAIGERQHQLDEIVADMLPARSPRAAPSPPVAGPDYQDDAELLRRAFNAANGRDVRALYDGDITGHDGDHSAADLALCRHLAFQTRDPATIDRIFRTSGLYREKWNERRGATTYGALTIDKALQSCTTSYTGNNTTHAETGTTSPPHRVGSAGPGPGPGKANGRIASNSGGSGSGELLPQMGTDTQLATLLRLHREEGFHPEPIDGLGPLPPQPSRAKRQLHAFLALCFGLLLADGTDGAMMLACSVLVHEGIVTTKQGASYLLHEFELLGIIWSPGSKKPLGKGDGTRVFLPGPHPDGPEPPGGWLEAGYRVLPRISDVSPDASLERSAVAIEAEDVERGVAVEPLTEAPDQAGVSAAVSGRAAGRPVGSLDGVTAANGGAGGDLGHVTDDNARIGAQAVLGVDRALAADQSDPPWMDEFLRRHGGDA